MQLDLKLRADIYIQLFTHSKKGLFSKRWPGVCCFKIYRGKLNRLQKKGRVSDMHTHETIWHTYKTVCGCVHMNINMFVCGHELNLVFHCTIITLLFL